MSQTRPLEPSSDDLHKVLSQVLESFAYALPIPRAEAADLGLSVHAVLPQEHGWLALRCSPVLAERLAQDSTGSEDPGLAQDAFAELCNLCVSHLVSRLWGDLQSPFRPFVPAPGLPQGVRKSAVLLDVDGEALEASHWSRA